jgi:hypothetical protein
MSPDAVFSGLGIELDETVVERFRVRPVAVP